MSVTFSIEQGKPEFLPLQPEQCLVPYPRGQGRRWPLHHHRQALRKHSRVAVCLNSLASLMRLRNMGLKQTDLPLVFAPGPASRLSSGGSLLGPHGALGQGKSGRSPWSTCVGSHFTFSQPGRYIHNHPYFAGNGNCPWASSAGIDKMASRSHVHRGHGHSSSLRPLSFFLPVTVYSAEVSGACLCRVSRCDSPPPSLAQTYN